MRFAITKLNISAKTLLRDCGYKEIFDRKTGQTSFVKILDPGRFYPRFHIYLEESPSAASFNLHLDAKKPSYEGTSAHSGEYGGAIVENEAQRIKEVAKTRISTFPSPAALGFKPTTSFWDKILKFLRIKKLP